jgi:GAF domain-containing protein
VTQTATSPQRKPLLDEASFQQLLSAAYVLQEHNDRLRGKEVRADFAENLSAIVETQKLIQTLQLDLPAAAELVAQRVQKITNASGTAIGILEKGQLFYRAATGSAASEAGTRVAPGSALSADCLSKGSALNFPDVTPSLHVHAEFFREREVKAFIAVPVYHAGQVAGVLELRFARPNSFREADVRTAELMAGLLSEAMATAARMQWKEALASERQSMLEALERIKPQIERLGNASSLEDLAAAEKPSGAPVVQPAVNLEARTARVSDTCSACGSDFFDQSESFCGICGAPRPLLPPELDVHRGNVPTKSDSPWVIPYGQENPSNGNSGGNTASDSPPATESTALPASLTPELEATHPAASAWNIIESHPARPSESDPRQPAEAPSGDPLRIVPADLFTTNLDSADLDSANLVPTDLVPSDLAAPADQIQPYPWGSAKKAQHWLETVKSHQGPRAQWLAQQWQRRRANIYLVAAAVILLLVISGWGIRPAGTTAAGNAASKPNAQQQAPAPPQLTIFEKLLVSLGLAEPPPAPIYMGNPDTQVWVDVHTALYYCPGGDLYGKTADGKFASQKDAQQDQFEPANRRACP